MVMRNRSEINALFRTGRYYHGAHFDVVYKAHPHEKKVVFAVARGVANHVKKNRIKRLLREVYRLNYTTIPLTGFHLAIVGKPATIDTDLHALTREFRHLMMLLVKS